MKIKITNNFFLKMAILGFCMSGAVFGQEKLPSDSESCKNVIKGGFETKFKRALFCRNVRNDGHYPILCYGDFLEIAIDGKSYLQKYRVVQLETNGPGGWSTSADKDTVRLRRNSISFTSDQGRTKTDVHLDFTSKNLSMTNYFDRIFGKEVIGTYEYICD